MQAAEAAEAADQTAELVVVVLEIRQVAMVLLEPQILVVAAADQNRLAPIKQVALAVLGLSSSVIWEYNEELAGQSRNPVVTPSIHSHQAALIQGKQNEKTANL